MESLFNSIFPRNKVWSLAHIVPAIISSPPIYKSFVGSTTSPIVPVSVKYTSPATFVFTSPTFNTVGTASTEVLCIELL